MDKDLIMKTVEEVIAGGEGADKAYDYGKVLERLVEVAFDAAGFKPVPGASAYRGKFQEDGLNHVLFEEINNHITTANGKYQAPSSEEAKTPRAGTGKVRKSESPRKGGRCKTVEVDILAQCTRKQFADLIKKCTQSHFAAGGETLFNAKPAEETLVVVGEIMLSLSEIRKKLQQLDRDLVVVEHMSISPSSLQLYVFVCGCYCHSEHEEDLANSLLEDFAKDHPRGISLILHFPIASISLLNTLLKAMKKLRLRLEATEQQLVQVTEELAAMREELRETTEASKKEQIGFKTMLQQLEAKIKVLEERAGSGSATTK